MVFAKYIHFKCVNHLNVRIRSNSFILLCNMKKHNITLLLFIVLLAVSAGCKKSRPVVVNATLQLVAQNMVAPVLVVEAPDSSKRLFIVDQVGKIWIVMPDGTMLTTPFIDVSSELLPLVTNYDERGLLGLAFHPDYKTNGKFYLC